MIYNIYCDESCHILNDHNGIMVVGSVWCPFGSVRSISDSVYEIKKRHGALGELKWNKVSMSKIGFYKEIIDLFFLRGGVNFRCIVVRNKGDLDHNKYNQGSHDIFYYKMYFSVLSKILSPDSVYNIFFDIKDTKSRRKLSELRDILCNNVHDFTGDMIAKMQNIRSHESALMQLCDFFTGAISYANRELGGNQAKNELISQLTEKYGKRVSVSTPLAEQKFNVFIFTPQKERGCHVND